jgi:outer membrane protein assembly factor BamB/subtilisin family serine protease
MSHLLRRLKGLLLAPLGAAALCCTAHAAPSFRSMGPHAAEVAQAYKEGVVMAKPKAAMLPIADQAERNEGLGLRARFERFGGIRVLKLAAGDTVPAAIKRLMATGRYEYVEPVYFRHILNTPNDPDFNVQWGLNNNGSNAGIAGADIHAVAGWDTLTSAPNVVVGMLDSGALTTHVDLIPNLWVNPHPGSTISLADGSSPVTETDSLNGLNGVDKTGIPTDDVGHGTFTSGVVGAAGNNAVGVCGVAWKVQLMELKFLASDGSGTTADELPCIDYAIKNGVKVINASFGSSGGSQAEADAIQAAGQAGIVFVVAAGNSTENIDISPQFPADYPLDNIVAVGATDSRDLPASFSNYGSGSVEIFAPGENIYSTSNAGTTSYGYESGTSLATPFVTGAVALLMAKYPTDTYRETINRVLNSADRLASLAGKAQTGGRLNLATALTTAAGTPPNATFAGRVNLAGLDPYTRSNNADSPAAPEPNTPATVAGEAGSHSLWWQWTAPQDASVEIDTSGTNGGQYLKGGSTFSTLLGVYTGSALGALTSVAESATFATEPLEAGGGLVGYSEVNFHATAGTTYQVLVQGQNGATGQVVLAINTDPDNDSVSSPRVLSGPSVSVLDANENATVEPGEPAILGNSGGHSLWYAWTAPASGPVGVSGYSYDFDPTVAVYTGTSISTLSLVASAASTGTAGTVTAASQCLCTFTATAGTTYLITVDGKTKDDLGEFTLSIDDSRWQAATGDEVTCSPAVGPDGTVYVGGDDNSFYAISQSGAIKWSHTATSAFDTSSAAVGPDGTVYAGSSSGTLYAFTPGGSVKWTYVVPTPAASTGLDNAISSSPAVATDGTIYFHDDDGHLYAINPAGTLKWTAAVSGVSYAAPTIAPDGTIYVGDESSHLYAVKPDGTLKWTYTTPVSAEQIYTAAAIDSAGNTYFASLLGNVYSVDPTGALRWKRAIGDGISSAPALTAGHVVFGGYDGNLYALSEADGTISWTFPVNGQVRASAPAVDANGVIYVGSYDHNVYAVSGAGALVRTYATDDLIRSSPVIAGTTLYFGSADHKVYAFDLGVGAGATDWPMYQDNISRTGRVQANALAITAQPATQTVAPGSTIVLSVAATGPAALSFQWYLNGAPIAGAVNSDYTIPNSSAANDGSYSVTVTSGGSSVTSTAATLTVATPLPPSQGGGRIVDLSARANVGSGADILIAGFVIEGSGSKNVLLRGIGPTLGVAPFNVAGVLAQPELTLFSSGGAEITSVSAWGGSTLLQNAMSQVGAFSLPTNSADSVILTLQPVGSYTSQLSGIGTSTGVALAEIYDADTGAPTAYLANISARASVGTGADILIAGFVLEGSVPVQLLLRGVGPTLGNAPFSVAGVVAQPSIALYDSAGSVITTNTGWGNASVAGPSSVSASVRQATASDMSNVGAFSLPAGSADSAMVVTLPAGSYTLQLSGVNGTSGVGLVEVYLMP